MCKLYFWDKHEAALIGPRDLGQNREHLKAGFCLLAKASYKSDYRATCRLDNWPERGKNRCHRRGQSSWNRLLTWRTIVIVVVRRVSPTAAFHCPTNSMEYRRPSLPSLSNTRNPFEPSPIPSLSPPPTLDSSSIPLPLPSHSRLSRFNAISLWLHRPQRARCIGVQASYEGCGVGRDLRAMRARTERGGIVGSRLCFFYSWVIKQFNITNTGPDNTSAFRWCGWVPQPPTTPFVTPAPSPLSPSPCLLERGRMFRFILLFSLLIDHIYDTFESTNTFGIETVILRNSLLRQIVVVNNFYSWRNHRVLENLAKEKNLLFICGKHHHLF